MQRAFRVLSCLFLTVLLAACATSSRIDSARDPALPGQSPGAATLRPDSSGLPALAALDGLVEAAGNRETSEICEIGNIQGRDFLAKSDNAFVTEDHKLLLTSTSGSHAWAVYEAFNAGSEISSCVLFASALAPGYYIALPDFTIGRWEFSELNPPNGNPFTIDLEAAERISPKQRQYFALVAVDGGQLLVDYALSNIKCISPQDSSVATTPFRELELLDCGGRPGLFFNSDEQQLRFGLAGSSAPAGPEDWQFSTVDSGNVGGIMQAVLHQGRPVVLYASFEDESLWLAWSGKAQPLADSDWQRRQLVPGANCKYCSIASSGDRLHIAWFRNDPLDSDVDNFYGYLDYGYTSGSDPQDSFSSYRLAELGNSSFAEFARPALALIDAEPAIAIVNVIPGVENRLLFLQATDQSPGALEWDEQILATDATAPWTSLSLLNGRPLVCYRDTVLRCMQGRSARPATAMDWNSSDLSGSLPRESFDWLPVYERPYYAFVSDQAGPLQIWYYGASPLRWQPQDDAVEEVQLRVGEQFDVGGECLLRLAAIAGRPALAYHEISSGNLHYVRLSVD